MGVDLELLIHLLNFSFLTVAVVMAIRMVLRSGFMMTWIVLASAFILMAVSPLLDLYGHLYQQNHSIVLESSDVLAIFSSLLVLVGIYQLRRIIAERIEAQQKLHQQLDELQRFHRMAVGRELRMKELVAENAALREQVARQELKG